MSLAAVLSTTVLAQSTATKPTETDLPETASLARFVPKEKAVACAEFAGLDAHTDDWRKMTASKMPNETPLGAMFEDVGAQVFDQVILPKVPNRSVTGADVVALIIAANPAAAESAEKAVQDASADAGAPRRLWRGTLLIARARQRPG